MIVHEIAPYAATVHIPRKQQKSAKFKGESGSIDHKRYIFERALSSNHFKEGQHVLHKKQPVQIVSIIHEFDYVEWDALRARFVEVVTDNHQTFLVHPSELRRKR